MKRLTLRKWGYGIVNKLGEPFWAESCVCQDKEPLLGQVRDMNRELDGEAPYRVIALYRITGVPRSSSPDRRRR